MDDDPTIDITVECDAWADALGDVEAIEDRLANAIRVTFAEARGGGLVVPSATEISIALCDDERIRALNRQWRDKDRPTNVLSFPAAPSARAFTLGDIAVAYETSAREASERGVSLADHLTHLVVHGVFHLLGLDHEDDDEAEHMESLESRTLAALSITSPFDPEDDTPRPPIGKLSS